MYDLGERWHPNLGAPFGEMYCVDCNCVAVSVEITRLFQLKFIHPIGSFSFVIMVMHPPNLADWREVCLSDVRSITRLVNTESIIHKAMKKKMQNFP